MPVTYDSIVSTTVTSNTNTISISNIPNTYTDLIVVIDWVAASSTGPTVRITLNNAGSYTYCGTQLLTNISNGGIGTGNNNLNAGFISAPRGVGIPSAADVTGILIYNFMSYTSSDYSKYVMYSAKSATGTGQYYGTENGGGCAITTAAISEISFGFGSNDWKAGTTVSVYGILRA